MVASITSDHPEWIVGVSELSDDPKFLEEKTSVGSFQNFSVESVLFLKPTIVFATMDGNPKARVLRLRELGIPVVVLSTNTYDELRRSILLIGQALGQFDSARKKLAGLDDKIESIKKISASRAKNVKEVALLQVGSDPLVVAGPGTFLDESLQLVGLKNAVPSQKIKYPRPSMEAILQWDPSWIFAFPSTGSQGEREKILQFWNRYPSLQAVRKKHIHVVRSKYLSRPSLRVSEGLRELSEELLK